MKILIVDDAGFIRELLTQFLNREGYYNIAEAASAEEAISMAATEKPDLVFLDIVLPEQTGLSVARQILVKNPHQKIVVVTSLESRQVHQEAIEVGCLSVLEKPFTRKQIQSVLHQFRGQEAVNG
jgi:two-component system chemotaxis response regulator CheY